MSETIEATKETADSELAIVARREELRLLSVARGCLDYGGGYRFDPKKLDIFHHGIQTVINALEAAVKHDPNDFQVNVLEGIGREAIK